MLNEQDCPPKSFGSRPERCRTASVEPAVAMRRHLAKHNLKTWKLLSTHVKFQEKPAYRHAPPADTDASPACSAGNGDTALAAVAR